MSLDLTWQPSLLDAGDEPAVDEAFSGAERIWLDRKSWIERVPGWVSGSDALFAHLVRTADWGQRTRRMWDSQVLEPRLTSWWGAETGKPLEPPLLERMRQALCARHGVEFDSMGLNLYRDGRDSVAWHGDTKGRSSRFDTMVAIVSFGAPRPLLLRPRGGGASLRYPLGHGDLIVMGGSCQRTWEHAVPKTARPVGPRVSVQFRPVGVV